MRTADQSITARNTDQNPWTLYLYTIRDNVFAQLEWVDSLKMAGIVCKLAWMNHGYYSQDIICWHSLGYSKTLWTLLNKQLYM